MILASMKPSDDWGPLSESNLQAWRQFKETRRIKREKRRASKLRQFLCVLVGCESKLD